MRPLRALFIYLVLVFLGGALLALWLCRLTQIAAPVFPWIAITPFYGFVDSSLLIFALVPVFFNPLFAGIPHAGPGFWDTNKLIDGWLAFLVLAITLAVSRSAAQTRARTVRHRPMTAFIEPDPKVGQHRPRLFLPEICRLCESERATARDGYVGAHCWSQVRFIKPPFCERCGLPFAGEITTPFECANCREMELHFSSARSAVVARGVVLEAIHRFKYRRQLWFENFLAGLFLREAVPALRGQDWDLIVPVPLHSLKQREREFNQAGRLARRLAATP